MIEHLINPADSPARQTEKLLTIATVLMRRVEQVTEDSGAAYAQFQRAAMLEDLVRDRTRDLERALDLLNASNGALAQANRETEAARQNLADAIETIQEGFALFDAADVLVMCNARFGLHMEDLRAHLKPGLTFNDYIDRVSRSPFLALPDGEGAKNWAIQRRNRHLDAHVIFNVRLIWDRWVQVSEHRTGDGGTVILQTDITDIIRMERQERGKLLDDQARVIRATLDHINQGVAIFDANSYLYITRAMDYFDLAADHGGVLANAFRNTPTRFCLVSFTSDWLFPTVESKKIVHALNAAGANVSFVEFETDRGHDAFLLDLPEMFQTLRGFIDAAAQARGLAAKA